MNAAQAVIELRGCLRRDEPMAGHTSWGVGGTADHFYIAADLEDLTHYIGLLPDDEPLLWLGLGSNLLVRDGGFHGTVLQVFGVLDACRFIDEQTLRVEAGVACAKVARESVKAGRRGAEFLAGIPGTFGGALAMNAGAFGGETWDLVDSVETVDRRGGRHVRNPGDYQIGYRSVIGPDDEWFAAAQLTLPPDRDGQGQQRIKMFLEQRAAAQPTGKRSCGSVFKNPPGDFAARLIDACGLKGLRVGGASISDKHANFIVHEGDATAADIETLIERVRARVRLDHGIYLEPEVRIVGEPLTDTPIGE